MPNPWMSHIKHFSPASTEYHYYKLEDLQRSKAFSSGQRAGLYAIAPLSIFADCLISMGKHGNDDVTVYPK